MYFIKSKILNKFKHGFFTKLGGVSKGVYNSLNCGLSSADKKENILLNRRLIADALNFKIENLIVANQYHSSKILFTDTKTKDLKCDGLINFSSKIAIGILTADCCPILVADKNNTITGCIHVGWKGLYNQIIENFIRKIESLNLNSADILFAIGPSIGKNSYQVSEIFRENFIKKEKISINFFRYDKISRNLYFDIKGLIYRKLKICGFKNISCSRKDTYTSQNMFFSYRYSCHNNKKDYGRMLSVIVKT